MPACRGVAAGLAAIDHHGGTAGSTLDRRHGRDRPLVMLVCCRGESVTSLNSKMRQPGVKKAVINSGTCCVFSVVDAMCSVRCVFLKSSTL